MHAGGSRPAEPDIAAVLAAVDAARDEMIGVLADLVRMPSVSGSADEAHIQHRLRETFAREGLETDLWQIPLAEITGEPAFPGMEVDRPEAWGLVGRLPATREGNRARPTLMFNAHVDVVPPGDVSAWTDSDPFAGRVIDGRLYGRGACDMKGGLVAALWAAHGLIQSGVDREADILLATVAGEEDGGLGTYALLRRGWRAEMCVIPEPTGLDLVPATAGALTFRLRVPGRATHASRRTEGESALEHFWPIWDALRDLEARRNRDTDPLMARWPLPYALSIGTARCGDWASSVPDLLVAEGRLGVMLDESVDDARSALEAAVAEVCASNRWLRDHPATVEWWGGQFASGRLPAHSDVLERVRAAHRRADGGRREPSVWGAPYGSDLRLMVGLGGIPTLHYGPGDAGLAHGPNESVPLDEVHLAARTLALLARDVITDRDRQE